MRAACIGIVKRSALAALLFATAARADFSILHHERLGDWRFGPDAKSSAVQTRKPSDSSTLSFTAFGREFNVRLESSDSLLRSLPVDARAALRGVQVLRRELPEVAGSWVRLTRAGRDITGVICDGAELFAIDSPVRLAPHPRNSAPRTFDGPIIFRWRDTAGTLTDELGAWVKGASSTEVVALSTAAPVPSPARQVDLGLVADNEFSPNFGSRAEAEMLARANVVDGIFIYQLGLHVNVAELNVFAQAPDPFAATDALALLAELEEHRAPRLAAAAEAVGAAAPSTRDGSRCWRSRSRHAL